MSVGEIAVRLAVPKSRVENALIEMGRIPVKWQKKIRLMSDGSQKKGDIPMVTAARITRLRGVTDKDKDNLLKHVSKNDERIQNVDMIGSLIKNGRTLNQAIKQTNKYRPIEIKVLVNKKRFEKIIKDEFDDSQIDFLIGVINKQYPKLAMKIANKS
jgi:hypothetical protein